MPTIKLLTTKKRDKNYNKEAYQDIYNTVRWIKLRNIKFINNPLCEDCLVNDIVKQTEEIHHIIPFDINSTKEDIYRLAYDYNNLISLCAKCHHKRHMYINHS